MNHIIHNIAIIILSLGIIMMTVYITRVSSPGYMTYEQKLIEQKKEAERRKVFGPQDIFEYRVSEELRKMFIDPEEISGYKTFDENEPSQKLYINSENI